MIYNILLAFLTLAGPTDYFVHFDPIYNQNVCKFDTVVDETPIKFVGELTGINSPFDGYGIITNFIVVYFEQPVKEFDFYVLNRHPHGHMTCWGWNKSELISLTFPLGSVTGTPDSDEWWWDICIIETNNLDDPPLSLFYMFLVPYED